MTNQSASAIILVGGFGTRLRPLTLTQPKALMPILNRPFLSYQFDLIKKAGIETVVLAANKRFRAWEKQLRTICPKNIKLHFAYEPKPLGTGGAIRFAYEVLQKKAPNRTKQVLVFNGDVLMELDVQAFINHHVQSSSSCTVALTRVDDPSRFGVVETTFEGEITRFLEKPVGYRGVPQVNAGAYVFNGSSIETIKRGSVVSVERDIFPSLLANGHRLVGFKMEGYWNDIGMPSTYLKAHIDLLKNGLWTEQRKMRKRGLRRTADLVVGRHSKLADDVQFNGAVCIGDNVSIGPSCVLEDCVIMNQVIIGAGTKVRGTILGRKCRIGENCELREGSVLGDGTYLPDYTRS